MKNFFKRFGLMWLDVLLELIVAVVFFGVGFLILKLFGVNVSALNMDEDIVVLIGVGAFVVVFVIAYAIIKFIKNRK